MEWPAGLLLRACAYQKYLQEDHADPDAPYGIDKVVMDNYVRSCAGVRGQQQEPPCARAA